MILSVIKVVVVGILAIALVVGLLVGLDPTWAVPALLALLGYVIGNARVTDNAPILSTQAPDGD